MTRVSITIFEFLNNERFSLPMNSGTQASSSIHVHTPSLSFILSYPIDVMSPIRTLLISSRPVVVDEEETLGSAAQLTPTHLTQFGCGFYNVKYNT